MQRTRAYRLPVGTVLPHAGCCDNVRTMALQVVMGDVGVEVFTLAFPSGLFWVQSLDASEVRKAMLRLSALPEQHRRLM